MIRAIAMVAAMTASAAYAQDAVPSGQPLVLWEVVWERIEGTGTQAVFRFIAPGVARDGGEVDAEAALADLDWLCGSHAVPIAGLPAARAQTVVVTLMDRPVPRGATDPDATQYFGLYVIEDGRCVPSDH